MLLDGEVLLLASPSSGLFAPSPVGPMEYVAPCLVAFLAPGSQAFMAPGGAPDPFHPATVPPVVATEEDEDEDIPDVDPAEIAPVIDPVDDFDEDDFDDEFDDDFEEDFEEDEDADGATHLKDDEEDFDDADFPDKP